MAFALKGNSCLYSISFYSSVCFLNTDHPTLWILHFCFIIIVVVILRKGCIFYMFRKMVQSSGWISTAYCLASCVHIEYTCQTQKSVFSGFKVPPFSFKIQSGIFCEPWTDTVHPQVHQQQGRHSHKRAPASSCFVLFLKMVPELPCPFIQALSSGASNKWRENYCQVWLACNGRHEFTKIRPVPASTFSIAS